MKVLSEYQNNNVLYQIVGTNKSIDNCYVKDSGDFFIGNLIDLAMKGASDFYNSPKNNKRSKKLTTIQEVVKPINKYTIDRINNFNDKWVKRESELIGDASGKNGSFIFTSLINKGH